MLLPDHTHVADISGTNASHVTVPLWIVWADRPYRLCPNCKESVQVVPDCPASMDPSTGETQSVNLTHGCGEWLAVRWIAVDSAEKVPEAAEWLEVWHAQDVHAARWVAVQDLTNELRAALARLAEPLVAGETKADREAEIITGRDDTPGIYHDGDQWLAWAHDVRDDGETITVYAAEIQEKHK
ncbi:hypothetical protein AB0G15_05705 [Streptosporangium sp. NPDC023825]|uniref:hypothetical protein n=1 Tax=Streptosporangium sp. NPDC023825 TaxID=3154909 RepID=UPI003412CA0D